MRVVLVEAGCTILFNPGIDWGGKVGVIEIGALEWFWLFVEAEVVEEEDGNKTEGTVLELEDDDVDADEIEVLAGNGKVGLLGLEVLVLSPDILGEVELLLRVLLLLGVELEVVAINPGIVDDPVYEGLGVNFEIGFSPSCDTDPQGLTIWVGRAAGVVAGSADEFESQGRSHGLLEDSSSDMEASFGWRKREIDEKNSSVIF